MPLPRAIRATLLAPYLAIFYPLLALRRAAIALRPGRSWRSWLTPQLSLGGFLLPGDVRELRQIGVGAVVNVSCELLDPVAALRAAGIDYLRVPCWDTRPPALDDAARGVAFIAGHIDAGRAVYVHCASGVGRSVVLALCYLATHGDLDAAEALRLVQRRRSRVALGAAQRAFVDRYVAWRRAEGARFNVGRGSASAVPFNVGAAATAG